ncbi:MAG: hypothetical protein WAN50_02915 [Minisyncoccia bacterium]
MNNDFETTLLCTRVRTVLKKFNITTLQELSHQSYTLFDAHASFGKESMKNLIEFMKLKGFKLAEMPPDLYWVTVKNVKKTSR